MADITSLSSLTGDDITADEITGLLKQIRLNIANIMLEGKDGARVHKVADRMRDRAKELDALLRQEQYWQERLGQIQPTMEVTVYDDPSL